MKNVSIRTKIFLFIIGIFTLLLTFVILSPTLFFEQYYTFQKKTALVDQTENFGMRYLNKNLSSFIIYDAMEQFSIKNDAYIRIVADDLLSTYSTNYKFEINIDEDHIISVYISDEFLYEDKDIFDALRFGDQINISGYWLDEDTICPRIINDTIIADDFFSVQDDRFQGMTLERISGSIVALNIPEKVSGDLYRSFIAWKVLSEEHEYAYFREGYKLYEIEDSETAMVSYVVQKEYEPYEVISVISLPQNSDVDRYIANYMQFAIIIGILAIVVFAFFLSRLISRPINDVTEAAKRISELDFSEKIPVKSDDELGALSKYMNAMSDKLEVTLEDLNTANNELKVKLWQQREIEDMRKQFIADVSHEVKTPLGIIHGYAERVVMQLLQVEADKEYVIDCASIIIDETKKMNTLINNMNELSRLESPAYELNRNHFELRDLVNETIEAFDVFLDEKDYQITKHFDTLKCYINGDQAKIEQVLINFLSNVIRYTPDGGEVHLTVDHRKSHIYFAIENECHDMTEDQVNKLWERFYRVDKSRSRAHGGSGIGLSIVKVILELHEYEFGVEKTDLGIRFYFYGI